MSNPGPRDRLAAAAGSSRPRVGNANIQWEPTFRGGAAQKIWQAAQDQQQRLPKAAVNKDDGVGGRTESGTDSSATSRSSKPFNFSGMFDELDGETRVDMHGVPVSDQYEIPLSGMGQRTSEGKVRVSVTAEYLLIPVVTDRGRLHASFRRAQSGIQVWATCSSLPSRAAAGSALFSVPDTCCRTLALCSLRREERFLPVVSTTVALE